MGVGTGFSDVDRSGRSAELVNYLAQVAARMADFRRRGNELLNLTRGSAVLDVGCGAGEMCVEIARTVGAAGRVVGIDPSAAMIEAAHGTVHGAACEVELAAFEHLNGRRQ